MSEPEPTQPRRSSRSATKASSAKRAQDETAEAAPAKKPRKTSKKTEDAGDEAPAEDSAAPPPSIPKLDIGDVLPELTLKNEKDEDVQVSTLAAEKGVILFLVPKADTPGCTNQACGFRDIYPDFTSLGYDVYCLSADTPAAQTKWQTKKELPYGLLSDKKRTLISALGAGTGGKTQRSHFIFEKGTGKLLEKKIPVKPAESPKLAMEFVKGLGKEGEAKGNEKDEKMEGTEEAEATNDSVNAS